jgi:4a-hydroxytetrahydrobiopterin dehydratase
MLRAIASSAQSTAITGIESRATAAASRLQAGRLLCPVQPQGVTLCWSPIQRSGRAGVATKGIEHEGDFGARDPFPGEIATDWGVKTLGNSDTDHVRRPPKGMGDILGLKAKHCAPCEGGNVPKLSDVEVEALRTQVHWKLITNAAGQQAIRHDYKVRNFKAAIDMFSRVAEVAEAEGHHPDLHLTGYNSVSIELTTHSVGGLTLNDFILADKINDLELSDLMPKRKPRYWA